MGKGTRLLLTLFLLCACQSGRMGPPILPTATPGSRLELYTTAQLQAARATLLGQVVTVRGVVTSVEPEWATLQSDGPGLLVAREAENDPLLAEEITVTGRVGEVEGNLALLELQEWLVEQAQVPLPEAAPLTLTPEQEQRVVQTGSGLLAEGGWLDLSDGRRVAVRGLDAEAVRRLRPGTRVDGVRGVLRRSTAGWLLLVPLARDVTVAPPLLSLCDIQGAARQSAHQGERVETVGVVTAALHAHGAGGSFVQMAGCDADPATSDALFILLPREGEPPDAGDRVRLRGRVEEFFGRTQLVVEEGGLLIEATGQALPAAQPLAPPPDPEQARDYWESLEGMMVGLDEAVVVAPTSRFGEFAVHAAASAPASAHVLRQAGASGGVLMVDDGGLVGPYHLSVGDSAQKLVGPLDFTFGTFKVQLLAAPALESRPPPQELPAPLLPPGAWSVATFNTENLFDSADDPGRDDADATLAPDALAAKLQKIAATLAGPLGLPTIVALQEVENLAVLEQLAAHPLLGGRYEARLLEGNDPRGIDQGLLVERERVEILELTNASPCSPVAVGDGQRGPCPEGEFLLFDRPPLIAHLRVDGSRTLYLINNHFKSKVDGEEQTRPRRVAQARFVAALVRQLQSASPEAEILVVGDLNDYEESPTLDALLGEAPLVNLWETVPPTERYAYVFEGVSQILDHILATEGLAESLVSFAPVHVNADFPHALQADPTSFLRTSDHDPLLAIFR